MALFQLDPESIVARARAAGTPVRPPGLGASILRGMIGFMLVSIAGFSPWAIFEKWLRGLGELELYLACTAVFIAMSGICLHKLIFGPGSLSRFYKLFSIAFAAYAVAWTCAWMLLHGDAGSVAGLLAGTAAMGAILAHAFDAHRASVKIISALFALNTAGYYAGEMAAGSLMIHHRLAAMLLWGACYGLGFGAGLGCAFFFCQERVRTTL